MELTVKFERGMWVFLFSIEQESRINDILIYMPLKVFSGLSSRCQPANNLLRLFEVR